MRDLSPHSQLGRKLEEEEEVKREVEGQYVQLCSGSDHRHAKTLHMVVSKEHQLSKSAHCPIRKCPHGMFLKSYSSNVYSNRPYPYEAS